MHTITLNISAGRRQRLIGNGCALVAFLPIYCTKKKLKEKRSRGNEEMLVYGVTSSITVPLDSCIQASADSDGRERPKRVRHEAMKEVVGRVRKRELRLFFAKTVELFERKCVPLLVWYCCHILEAKDMSTVRRGVLVTRPCTRCVVSGGKNITGEMAGERPIAIS